jgi:exosortase E/protease (VPEID-CTERM system)
VGTSTFQVEIAPACSGYEGMALVLILVGTYLWVARQSLRFPRALILLPVGLVVIWVANVLRITTLVALGAWGLGAVALGGFHSQVGWLAFDAIGLGLVLLAGGWSYLRVEPSARVARDDPHPSAPYLVPFLALMGTSMLTGAFASGSDGLYPLRLVTAAGALWIYRRRLGELGWTFSIWPVLIGCGAFVLWMALEPLAAVRWAPQRSPGAWLQGLSPAGTAVWLAARVGGSILIVPLVEELAFRGYLTRRLISTEPWSLPMGAFSWPSFLISSALFGLLHDRWLAGTLTGMLFGLALYRRGKLADAVLAHATTNALIAAWVLMSGDWSLWL